MSSIAEIKLKYYKKIDPLDLDLILEKVTGKPRSFTLAHPELKITNYELRITNKYLKQRINGKPLAYVLGYKEFYGLKFKVNKYTLVPRPETEMMIDHITHITHRASHIKQFIDVGTGSGCIIVALAKILSKKYDTRYAIRDTKFSAIDISTEALKIARQNAKFHGVNKKIKFIKGNLLNPFLKSKILNPKSEILILANLPYLTPSQIKNSPTIKHEPRLALAAGNDGLKYYRELLKQIKLILKSARFLRVFVFMEIDPSQSLTIKKIINKELPGSKIKIKKDLRGLNRLVEATISSY